MFLFFSLSAENLFSQCARTYCNYIMPGGLDLMPSTSWQTTSNYLADGDNQDRYDVFCTAGNTYYFSLCSASGGGSADYDTYLCLLGPGYGCGYPVVASNDDNCGIQSYLTYTPSSSSWFSIIVSGYSSDYGSYTLAYMYTSPTPCTPPTPAALPAAAATAGITGYTPGGYISTGKGNCWYSGGSDAPSGNGTGTSGYPDPSDMGMSGIGGAGLSIPGYGGSYSGLTYTYTTNGTPSCNGSFYVIDASTFGSATPSLGCSGRSYAYSNPYSGPNNVTSQPT